jgi:Ca-activated chloride channel family protein
MQWLGIGLLALSACNESSNIQQPQSAASATGAASVADARAVPHSPTTPRSDSRPQMGARIPQAQAEPAPEPEPAPALVESAPASVESQVPVASGQSFAKNVAKKKQEKEKTVDVTAAHVANSPTIVQAPGTTERYEDVAPNPVKIVAEEPVSTFSIDVDTAAYANVRRFLRDGALPPRDAVRVEEMVNYFDYAYALPEDRTAPFATSAAVMPTPWNPNTKLLHIGIKGYDIARGERPRANLVFLIDVSGSMQSADKLPLVKQAMNDFARRLGPDDSVAIVVYAGSAGTVLEPTPGRERGKILAALDSLRAGGGTAGGEGIREAYALAERGFDKAAVNRVILATDGDFNVGITDPEALEDFVARKRETGIYLSVLGFGTGNINDLLMQKLAQSGNGNAAYIDSLMEGHRVLIEEAAATLFPIANDVKIQIEFNPAVIAEYRLIGYETRALKREDFNNDAVDAGEIGSGHEVTALYEITPVGSPARLNEPLRYGGGADPSPADRGREYAFLRLRYKLPGESESRLIERPVAVGDEYAVFDSAPAEARFAVAVAAFGQLLRGDRYLKGYGYDDIIALAQPARGADEYGYRAEFVQLVRLASSAQAQAALP